jgi:hypothetical protein
MTSPAANITRSVAHAWIGNVTSVDTVAGVCSVDIGDGDILAEVLYLGAAPKVGAQVVLFMFNRTSVVLGGTG